MQSQIHKMSHNTYKLSRKSKWKIQEKFLKLIWAQNLKYLKKRSKTLNNFFPKDLKRLKMLWKMYPLVKGILFSHKGILKILKISQSLDIQNETKSFGGLLFN